MDFEASAKSRDYLKRVKRFMRQNIEPVERKYWEEILERKHAGDWKKWQTPPLLEELKEKAKAEGLWNLFLPDEKLGAGLTTLEYAPHRGGDGPQLAWPPRSSTAARPTPATWKCCGSYGSDEQKERWLKPLLAGEIRSVFCMTEPDVASSDATNMQATAIVEGDEIVLNGKKWWTSGLGDPQRQGRHLHGAHARTRRPTATTSTPWCSCRSTRTGVTIKRMLPVFGEYDAPHGHGEVHFDNVRVPRHRLHLGPGMGFEIAQGRLGPGRIHHCMRCLGAAERALELMIERGMNRKAFGKPLMNLGGNRERVAEARIAIDQARLLTLYAAWKIDKVGALAAMTEISAIKVVAPNVLQKVVDDAIQIHGGAGVSHDTPLAAIFAMARTLRLADGPDEVHKGLIARLELAKRGYTKG